MLKMESSLIAIKFRTALSTQVKKAREKAHVEAEDKKTGVATSTSYGLKNE